MSAIYMRKDLANLTFHHHLKRRKRQMEIHRWQPDADECPQAAQEFGRLFIGRSAPSSSNDSMGTISRGQSLDFAFDLHLRQ